MPVNKGKHYLILKKYILMTFIKSVTILGLIESSRPLIISRFMTNEMTYYKDEPWVRLERTVIYITLTK